MIETSLGQKCMQRKTIKQPLGQFQKVNMLKNTKGLCSESPLMACVLGYKSQLFHKKACHQTALIDFNSVRCFYTANPKLQFSVLAVYQCISPNPPIPINQRLVWRVKQLDRRSFWKDTWCLTPRHISTTLALMANCCDIHHMCKHILQRPKPPLGPFGGTDGPVTAAPPVGLLGNFHDHPRGLPAGMVGNLVIFKWVFW